eukprot:3439205-Pyramimonas_sp.AAC.1
MRDPTHGISHVNVVRARNWTEGYLGDGTVGGSIEIEGCGGAAVQTSGLDEAQFAATFKVCDPHQRQEGAVLELLGR